MKKLKVEDLNAPDLLFATRLMAQPSSGLAWAKQALASPSHDNHSVAIWCCMQSGLGWSAEERQSSHRARMEGLAHNIWGSFFAQELPRMWRQEQESLGAARWEPVFGVSSWIEALTDLKGYGVDPENAEALALGAVGEPLVAAALDKKNSEQIEQLFDLSVATRSCAPMVWQVELGQRLSPEQSGSKIVGSFVGSSSSRRSKMDSAARETCALLASQALGAPAEARKIMHGLLLHGVDTDFWQPSRGLPGLFDALAANPRPNIGATPDGRSKKIFESFKGPLSLAMELMCRRQFEAGLSAARWVAQLGGAGQEASGHITDGIDNRSITMKMSVFETKGFSRGEISTRFLSEPAMLFKRADVCEELLGLGWGWPGKERVAALAKELSILAEQANKNNSKCYIDANMAPSDAAAGLVAFWESIQIKKMLGKRSASRRAPEQSDGHLSSGAAQPKAKGMRI